MKVKLKEQVKLADGVTLPKGYEFHADSMINGVSDFKEEKDVPSVVFCNLIQEYSGFTHIPFGRFHKEDIKKLEIILEGSE